ncbi:hypothetical protein RRG08_059401 [Elysia crispata]|uniref:Uncharacterized protein n=1 Tax=Elysia crispata TaxID=231223 RepID=A0AAE0ZGB7_9GAST|nr:hypothetical protein RRG08_059401 [Elysia crispata]
MAMILFDMRARLGPDGKPEPDQLWLPVTPRNYGKISSGAALHQFTQNPSGISPAESNQQASKQGFSYTSVLELLFTRLLIVYLPVLLIL